MHIHLDPLGGLAGDMFLAAMLDAWPDLLDPVLTAIRAAGVPADWTVGLTDHKSHGLTGRRFRVTPPDQPSAIDHGPHAHTAWAALRARLETAPLAAGVKARAIAIFALLAEAEAAVHGTSPDAVTFHEVAAWDSVADIVGAAALIDALAADNPRWSVAPLPLGRGRVQTQHGILPVPAPATVKLLHGFATLDDGIVGERVTPTGAAILRQIGPDAALPSAPLTLIKDGTGFGMRCLETVPNMLRVLVFDSVGAKPIGSIQHDRVAVLEWEIDDQPAEDLAVGLDNLRGIDGVLDVIQTPVIGKKGRLGVSIRLLCRIDRLHAVIAASFIETTSIGLRWAVVERAVLGRQAFEGAVRVKQVTRPDGRRTAKAEIDDVRDRTGGFAERAAARHRACAGLGDETRAADGSNPRRLA